MGRIQKSFLAMVCVVASLAFSTPVSYGAEEAHQRDEARRVPEASISPWSYWVWRISRIVTAPKLLYRLDRMEVYRDGVWVDYTLSNFGPTRKYVTPMFLDFPVGHMFAWDNHKRAWCIPQFHGFVEFDNPDTFISMEPFTSIRFRSQVSFIVHKPIEPVDSRPVLEAERPEQLTYLILEWSDAYTKLTENRKERAPVFTLGFGKVSVKWTNRNAPGTWRSHTRLRE